MSNKIWVGPTSSLIHVSEVIEPLLFEFPDLPDSMAEYYVMEAVREIVRSTGGIRYEGELAVYCGVTDYMVPHPECFKPMALVEITDSGMPMRYSLDTDSWQITFPSIARTRVLNVVVNCQLAKDACEFPEYLNEEWGSVILAGAKAKLHLLTNMDFFSVDLATFYERKFEEGLSDIANAKAFGGIARPLMMDFGRTL